MSQYGERLRILYEYDFGDSWTHEVLLESLKPSEPGGIYPLCLAGNRACPPEDCGGVWGYVNFLQAIGDKKHPEHEAMLDWIGGTFNPEAFDPAKATKAMHKGLKDWRNMDF